MHDLLDGIFKPISDKGPYFSKGKFLGILVFNHLPPSDTDWHTNHSLFRFKIIEQGQLSYPKICPYIFSSSQYKSVHKAPRHTLLYKALNEGLVHSKENHLI